MTQATVRTADFSGFGYRELALAGDILKYFENHSCPFFLDPNTLAIGFNDSSGDVFLTDSDYNVALLEDNKLVQFFSCPMCGYEGTQEEALADNHDFESHDGYCSKDCENENEGK